MIKVLGIRIIDRIKEAGLTQNILSKYSGIISTRLGFHELTADVCSREAFIILHLSGSETEAEKLQSELQSLGGIDLREMVFDSKKQFVHMPADKGALRILGILVEKKGKSAIDSVRKIFTSYGCVIRTRLGVNEEFYGNPAGLIIVELTGDEIQMDLLEKDLQKLSGIILRKMVF